MPFVLFEGEVLQPGCDIAEGTFENSYGSGPYMWTKACDIPCSETTAFVDWWPSYPTIGRWRGYLSHVWSLGGRKVTEYDSGGGGPDTCYFSGSEVPEFIAITAGDWDVTASNTWQFDHVGVTPAVVSYYRAAADAGVISLPCGSSFGQTMAIDCSDGDSNYANWTLGYQISLNSVGSMRGTMKLRAW